MKTKVFEPGAICAAVALLVVLSLPAYAKSGGSSAAHTRVGNTNATTRPGTVQPQRIQTKMDQKSKQVEMLSNTRKKAGSTGDAII
jgi:hypothetical protein